jgi:hypothetical protein
MNDFELRRELRELRVPREPQRDLWTRIARKIQAQPESVATPQHRRTWLPLAAAASIALAVTVGVLSVAMQRMSPPAEAGNAIPPSAREQIERARELATSGDPRLAGAEVVIDAASSELELALQHRPDAVFLVGLINRTHAQRRKLARLGLNAG